MRDTARFIDFHLDHPVSSSGQTSHGALHQDALPPIISQTLGAGGLENQTGRDGPQKTRGGGDEAAVVGQVANIGVQIGASVEQTGYGILLDISAEHQASARDMDP